MASDGVNHAQQDRWLPVNPWHVTLAGLCVCGLAWFLQLVQGWGAGDSLAPVLVPIRALLIFAGLVLAGGGVSLRLRTATWEFEERAVSAALTSVAAFTVLVAWLAMDDAWDSMKMLLTVLAVVAFAGVGLILLPRTIRRVVFLVIVVFHFGGILNAITSAPPPGSPAPWITRVLWVRVYRPYLQFMYLNNAYHFYSPDPGPANQLWFYVKFTDGSGEWLKVPERKDYATHQEYQRLLALTESANQIDVSISPSAQMMAKRNMAANLFRPTLQTSPYLLPGEYQEPFPAAKFLIRSYAKHVARTYKSAEDPDKEVASVKVYRVLHRIVLPPDAMAEDWDPLYPAYFVPYYQGEFDKDGAMLDPRDPFLYWNVPILYQPKDPFKSNLPPNRDDFEIVDYCKMHAEGKSK
jgi:hypothetical protein